MGISPNLPRAPTRSPNDSPTQTGAARRRMAEGAVTLDHLECLEYARSTEPTIVAQLPVLVRGTWAAALKAAGAPPPPAPTPPPKWETPDFWDKALAGAAGRCQRLSPAIGQMPAPAGGDASEGACRALCSSRVGGAPRARPQRVAVHLGLRRAALRAPPPASLHGARVLLTAPLGPHARRAACTRQAHLGSLLCVARCADVEGAQRLRLANKTTSCAVAAGSSARGTCVSPKMRPVRLCAPASRGRHAHVTARRPALLLSGFAIPPLTPPSDSPRRTALRAATRHHNPPDASPLPAWARYTLPKSQDVLQLARPT